MDRPDIPDFFNARKFTQGGFDPDDFLSKNKFFFILILLVLFVVPNLVILVGAGQHAVVFNRISGMEKRVLPEGIQVVVPFLQKATTYNTFKVNYVFSDKTDKSSHSSKIVGNSINSLTSDGQNILVDVTVRAKPDVKELWWLHQNIGKDTYDSYVEKIITPMVRSVVRQVVAGYPVSAMYSDERLDAAKKISDELDKRCQVYKISLVEFLLDEITFSEAYQNAIEKKQRATIELDTKDNIIVEERNKRDAAITKAQGEAEAIRLKVNALARNPDYIKFRKAQILGKKTKLIINDDF